MDTVDMIRFCLFICFLIPFLVTKFCTISIYLGRGICLSLLKMIMSGTQFPRLPCCRVVIRLSQSDTASQEFESGLSHTESREGRSPSGSNDISSDNSGCNKSHCHVLASLLRKASSNSFCRVVFAVIPAALSPFHIFFFFFLLNLFLRLLVILLPTPYPFSKPLVLFKSTC